MQSIKKMVSLILVLLITLVMSTPIISIAAELPIDLGTAESFAILAGQTITNTGTTTINGNVGISPGSALTPGAAIINGEVHLNDATAILAQQHLVLAYDDSKARMDEEPIPAQLGGSTLLPGYYVSEVVSFNLTGTLTLDANNDPDAIFIFEAGSTLVTAADSNVILINGAKASQIFWNVGSSATLGISSHLEGTILAMESITLTTSATVNGSLLARNGSVTLDSNTVTVIDRPDIAIDKTANTALINNGPEVVNYSYSVSNPGTTNLTNIVVSDDKINTVNYVSGDLNNNSILEQSEVWLYTASVSVSGTTTNTGSVSANFLSTVVTATDQFTVTVQTPETTTTATTTATTTTESEAVFSASPTTTSVATTSETTSTSTEPTTESNEVALLVDTTISSTEEATSETENAITETTAPTTENEFLPVSPVVPGGSLPQTATPLVLYISGGALLIVLGLVGWKFSR